MDVKKLLIALLGAVCVIGLVAAVLSAKTGFSRPKVSFPYVCKDCGAVFDIQELRGNGGKNWRIPKGAPSDSVVICIKCNKGWAYPVGKCDRCGTEYILHRIKDGRCPKCFPEAAEAAKKAGVDIIFHRR